MALEPGYVFETVFSLKKGATDAPTLVADVVNGEVSTARFGVKKILTTDRRALPGVRVRVKVKEVSGDTAVVEYLEIVDFSLEDVFIEPKTLKKLEALVCFGRSILLDGPQGTGKTTIARALAKELGLVYVFFNCSVCFEPGDFVGALQLLVDAKGKHRTAWVATEILESIREALLHPDRRYLIFLDELNRCRAQALNGIMSAIDSTRRIFDPEKNAYIEIPDNIQWIAAINSGKHFFGTFRLDVAQLDRFAVLKLAYPPESEEVKILRRSYQSLKEKDVRRVVRVANAIRGDPSILSDLSVRATDEACLFLSYPSYRGASRDDLIDILETAFCNRLPGGVAEEGSEAQIAREIIERRVRLAGAIDD